MGRPRKSAAQKNLEGNPGKREITKESKLPKGMPNCPRELCPRAKAEWKRISKRLYDLGLLCDVDRAALALYCQNFADWAIARKILNKEGLFIKAPSGYKMINPAFTLQKQAQILMHKQLVGFGLNPQSRNNVAGTKQPGAGDNDGHGWEGLLT